MRHQTQNRRHRNRNNNTGRRNNGNQSRTQVYDSNGPDVRIRGTANQVAEKYLALAKDATSMGDHMVAQNYFQHAEHYIRIINEMNVGMEAKKVNGADNSKVVADDEGNKKTTGETPVVAKKPVKQEADDLGLPASILGAAKPEVKQEAAEAVE